MIYKCRFSNSFYSERSFFYEIPCTIEYYRNLKQQRTLCVRIWLERPFQGITCPANFFNTFYHANICYLFLYRISLKYLLKFTFGANYNPGFTSQVGESCRTMGPKTSFRYIIIFILFHPLFLSWINGFHTNKQFLFYIYCLFVLPGPNEKGSFAEK